MVKPAGARLHQRLTVEAAPRQGCLLPDRVRDGPSPPSIVRRRRATRRKRSRWMLEMTSTPSWRCALDDFGNVLDIDFQFAELCRHRRHGTGHAHEAADQIDFMAEFQEGAAAHRLLRTDAPAVIGIGAPPRQKYCPTSARIV